jgi:hypothetical protein
MLRPPSVPAQHSTPRLGSAVLIGLLAASLSAAAVVGASAASAAVPTAPNNLLVFPNRDFISVEGYQDHVGQLATMTVTRSGVVVGSAQAVVAVGDVAFEVNHPGGACWGDGTGLMVTPDILPGDVASISFDGVDAGDTRIQDGYVNADAVLGTTLLPNDTVLVSGHVGAGVIQDNTEQRIVDPTLTAAAGKRDVRALPGPVTRSPQGPYSSGLAFNDADHTFVATYVFDDPAVAQIAANASLGERLLSWESTDAAGNRQGVTIAEFGEVGGPGFGGCPASAFDAATLTAPQVLNSAVVAAGGDLTISGVSYNSSEVSVAVKDSAGITVGTATAKAVPTPLATATTVPLPGNQTWTTTIPISALDGVGDGRLELAITTKRLTAGPLPTDSATEAAILGASKFLLKDTRAPAAPSVSPGTGTYVGAQHVSVTGAADTTTLRYQLGGPAVADPTLNVGTPVTGQIVISSSQTLKVVGFDAAGNPSPVRAATFTINAPVTPQPPVVTPPVPPVTGPAPVAPAPPVPVTPATTVPVTPATTTPAAPVATAPGAPRIGRATGGKTGGKVTARITWTPPLRDGGSPITSYRVSIRRVGSAAVTTRPVSALARSLTVKGLVRNARYRFSVVAVNARGTSVRSAQSIAVVSR